MRLKNEHVRSEPFRIEETNPEKEIQEVISRWRRRVEVAE
jgi:hypothetical protein